MFGPRIKVGLGLLLQSRIVPTHAIDYKLNIFKGLTFTKRNDIVRTLSRAVFFLLFFFLSEGVNHSFYDSQNEIN